MTNRSIFTIFAVAGCMFAHGSAIADELCVNNPESGANRPDICVDWDQGDQPTQGVDFEVFFTDLANPDVELKTGAAWNVRSKDNAGNPANIGDIKIDATVVTLVDEGNSHLLEDVAIHAFEDCVTLEQYDARTDRVDKVL